MAIGLHGFSETMSGTWTPDAGGGRRVFRFTVDADATNLWQYFRRGAMRLTGSVYAEGLCDDAPAQGTLEVQPLRGRIAYRLHFTAPDGQRYQFDGHKSLTLRSPLRSSTTLPGRIVDAQGRRVGTCLTYFDLRRDLGRFLLTFRAARPALSLQGAR